MWGEIAGWTGLVGAMWLDLILVREAYMRMARKEKPKLYDDSSYKRRNSPHLADWPPIILAVVLTPISLPIFAFISIKRSTVGTNREMWERKKAKQVKWEADMKKLEKETKEYRRIFVAERDRFETERRAIMDEIMRMSPVTKAAVEKQRIDDWVDRQRSTHNLGKPGMFRDEL